MIIRNKIIKTGIKTGDCKNTGECRNCGHIIVGTAAPEICPTCDHPKAHFEIHAENY